MSELLHLERVRAGYGESTVLDDLSLAISEGESLALLGRNGMGKSTLLMTLMGLTRLHSGSMRWRGGDLARLPTYRRARAGLGWVPQERGMFASLSVKEHLTAVERPGAWGLAKIYSLFPRLAERSQNLGNELSGGEQQMVAIARALMTNPTLLLLDEPMEGLAPIIVAELVIVLKALVEQSGMTVIIVEQHARLALALTTRAIVLERGRIIHDGPSAALAGDTPLLERLIAVS